MRRNLIVRWLPLTGNRVKEIYEKRGGAIRGRDVDAWMGGGCGKSVGCAFGCEMSFIFSSCWHVENETIMLTMPSIWL